MPNWSLAVTVALNAAPAVCGFAAPVETVKCVVAAGATETEVEPVIEPADWSVADTVWPPAVFRAKPPGNDFVPLSPATNW